MRSIICLSKIPWNWKFHFIFFLNIFLKYFFRETNNNIYFLHCFDKKSWFAASCLKELYAEEADLPDSNNFCQMTLILSVVVHSSWSNSLLDQRHVHEMNIFEHKKLILLMERGHSNKNYISNKNDKTLLFVYIFLQLHWYQKFYPQILVKNAKFVRN